MAFASIVRSAALCKGVQPWKATQAAFKAFLSTTAGADNAHSISDNTGLAMITTGTTLSGLGATSLTNEYTAFSNADAFEFIGGGAYQYATIFRLFPVATRLSSGNVTATLDAIAWRVAANVDAAKVAIRVSGSTSNNYRFRVNGRYISKAGTTVGSGGAATYALLDFGSKAPRLVEVEGMQSHGFVSFSVAVGDTVSKPTPDAFPALFLGDSFVAATGAGGAMHGYAAIAADYQGSRQRWMSGLGGTGYVATTGTTIPLGIRLAADLDRMIAIAPPKIIDVAMGLNDLALSGVAAAASSVFDMIRLKCPSALVFITGPWDTAAPSAPSANYTTRKSEIMSAMAGRGGFFFLDPQGVSFTKIGDNVHPDPAGHIMLGIWRDQQVRAAMMA